MINKDDIKKISSEKELISFINENYKNMDFMEWHEATNNPNFSNKILKKVLDKIHWEYFSMFYRIPEDIIENNRNKVFWYLISLFQPLSAKFIENNKKYLCLEPLSRNEDLPADSRQLAIKFFRDNNTPKTEKYTTEQLYKTMFYRDDVVVSKNKTTTTIDYNNIRKPELKRILDERGVTYNSGDPVVLLRQKCRESENDTSK